MRIPKTKAELWAQRRPEKAKQTWAKRILMADDAPRKLIHRARRVLRKKHRR